jgi:hypothetical protein
MSTCYSASTLIAHRLADPDPIVTRAGTIRRPERSHQLDPTGATGMGSLRLQDTYRIDPNDVRSLPPGVAYIVTGGRAAKVAVAATRAAPPGPGGPVPLDCAPRPTGDVCAGQSDDDGGGEVHSDTALSSCQADTEGGDTPLVAAGDRSAVSDRADAVTSTKDAGAAAPPVHSPAMARTASPYTQGL